MVTLRPFRVVGATSNIAIPTTTATAVAIPGTPRGSSSVRLVNDANETTFVAFGTTEAIAIAACTTTTGFPMVAGSVETFEIRNDLRYVAAVSVAGNGILYVTGGEGA